MHDKLWQKEKYFGKVKEAKKEGIALLSKISNANARYLVIRMFLLQMIVKGMCDRIQKAHVC